ncbi:MmgE/PrpD family protein [Salinarimonas rosea]|uniref:MmgE/PrpD family protein n=1 Tax=Salinarimonas rosea TaxID=552063 RepID=UPI00040F4AFC|nr:MmgE/PrpD family protein [Salinarimonas rosea]
MRIVAEPVPARPATPGWALDWGRFAESLAWEDLPGEVVSRTRLVVADCIAAIAAGAQEPETKALAERLLATVGVGPHPLIGARLRGSAAAAALFNGTAGTTLELDEGNQYARGHPGIHVVPAALIAAQRAGATGRDLITAIALGYEVGARIGIASKLRVSMHPHGTWGTVGAAVAVAKLHGASAAQIVEAMSVASSLGLTTSRRTMLEGGTVRNSFAGFSNQIGLTVWDLVCAGFTGEADGVGTVYGTVAADDWRPQEMTAELGTRWEIARNYFKRHACCRYNHAALDALARITARERVAPDAIERIEVDTYVWAAQLASPQPHNMLAAKFSLPFSIATTLVHGAATVDAFRDAARADERVLALARRVVVREDEALTARLPAERAARVRIDLSGGRTVEETTFTNRGDTEDPYDEGEIAEKFLELATPVWGARSAGLLLATLGRLEAATGLNDIYALIAR